MIKMSVYNKKRTLSKRLRKDEDRGGGNCTNDGDLDNSDSKRSPQPPTSISFTDSNTTINSSISSTTITTAAIKMSEQQNVYRQRQRQQQNQRQSEWPYRRQCYRFNKHNKLMLGLCIVVVFLIENCWAGFACLSNPCIFGVCLDDINR